MAEGKRVTEVVGAWVMVGVEVMVLVATASVEAGGLEEAVMALAETDRVGEAVKAQAMQVMVEARGAGGKMVVEESMERGVLQAMVEVQVAVVGTEANAWEREVG